jgi:mannose-6-phosphate isomerase-like protein (cupin superfamily)
MSRRFSFLLAASVACVTVTTAQTPVPAQPPAPDPAAQVIYIDAAKAGDMIAKTGLITNNPGFMVAGAHRGAPGQVEVHEKTTDILYIVEGEAVYVTGGKVINGKQTRPGEWIGESIEGGTEHHLKKGDVIIVPAGQPHWFKSVAPQLNSFMVRVNKP